MRAASLKKRKKGKGRKVSKAAAAAAAAAKVALVATACNPAESEVVLAVEGYSGLHAEWLGVYERQDEVVEGRPTFKKPGEEQYLFYTTTGKWAVHSDTSKDSGVWVVESAARTPGAIGHFSDGPWMVFDGYEYVTPLYSAAQDGHEVMVEQMIGAGTVVDQATGDGVTPLWGAAQEGHEAVVRLLLAAGAAVDQVDEDGTTPLRIAASEGHEAVVRLLVEAQAAVNQATGDGVTPLWGAAQEGHEAVVRLLLAASAAVDQVDEDGWTPLHVAAQWGHVAVVDQLLAAGAVADGMAGKTASMYIIHRSSFIPLKLQPTSVNRQTPTHAPYLGPVQSTPYFLSISGSISIDL